MSQSQYMTYEANFHWLVGLLEGEGSFMAASPSRPNEPRLEVEMKDRPVMARFAAFVGASVIERQRKRVHADGTEDTIVIYRVRVAGKRAVRLMRTIQPYLCARRQHQIDAALATFTPKTARHEQLVSLPYEFNQYLCAEPMCDQNAKLGAYPFCGAHHRHPGDQQTYLLHAA